MHWARCQRQKKPGKPGPTLADDFAAMGAPPATAARLADEAGDDNDPELFDVWRPNAIALGAFIAARDQFRYAGLGGPIGLDAAAVDVVLTRMEITLDAWEFGALMDMGRAAAGELQAGG